MKIRAIPLCLYILSLFFLAVGCVSLIACHHTITAQLSQGVPVDGNELQILSLYLQSCAQYLAFSVLFFLGGRVYRIFVPPKAAVPRLEHPEEPPESMDEEEFYQVYGSRQNAFEDDAFTFRP